MKIFLKYLLPIVLGVLLLPVPLLRDFHFESALIAATVGCFWGGLSAAHWLTKKDFLLSLRIFRSLYLFGLPLFIYSAISGCLTWDGIGFWILVPVPSVFFGISIGRLFRKLYAPLPGLLTFAVLLFVAVGVLLIEFLTLPQVYFFNHVWGIWPGPIYDEAVQVTSSLLWFRTLSFFWIILFWAIPEWNNSTITKTVVVSLVFVISLSYFWLPDFGIITPRSHLKGEFRSFQTEHFDIYYDGDYFTSTEVDYWAKRHEFHLQQLNDTLDIEWPEDRRVESYLYANAWQKKKLVGAKFTSYVPVWLEQDQLHIAKQHLEAVLKHELVHVVSKQFGNRLFNGSWNIGLVEGVAEALAGDASRESTLDQILAADPPYPTSDQMKNALSLSGFYSSASSISYTTAGSFIGYLLREYPVENLKTAYPYSDFETAYGVPFETLVDGWQQTLPDQFIDSVDQNISNQIFSQRSIFQRFCPHAVSPTLKLWDRYRYYISNERHEEATPIIEALYELHPENPTVKREWIYNQFNSSNYSFVINSVSEDDSTLTFPLFRADALFLNGNFAEATRSLSELEEHLEKVSDPSFRYSYELRSDSLQWQSFLNNRYLDVLPTVEDFIQLNSPNKAIILSDAYQHSDSLHIAFAEIVIERPLSSNWFDIYENTIDRLAYLGEFELAQRWINEASELELRERYQERLDQQREWFKFLMRVES